MGRDVTAVIQLDFKSSVTGCENKQLAQFATLSLVGLEFFIVGLKYVPFYALVQYLSASFIGLKYILV